MSMDKQGFLTHTGLRRETLELWLEQRWLLPEQTAAGAAFSGVDVARAHLIMDLQADLGVNDEGVDVILHLMDQLHGLRQALRQVHRGAYRAPHAH